MSNIKFGLQLELKGDQVVVKGLDGTRTAVSNLEREVDKNAQSTVVATQNNQKFAGSLGSLSTQVKAFGGILAAVGFAGAIRGIVTASDEMANIEARIKLVTSSSTELADVQQRLFEIAQYTGSEYSSVAELYTKVARAAGDLGLAQADILNFTQLTNQAFQISGASTAEAAGATRQLAQALQSGVLRGDEFNSINEQGGRIMQALADGLRVARGDLRAMAEAGELTAERVMPALLSQASALNAEFGELPNTVGRARVMLENEFQRALAGANVQPLTDSINDLRETIADPAIQQAIGNLSGALVGAFATSIEWVARLSDGVNDLFGDVMRRIHGPLLDDAEAIKKSIAEIDAQISSHEAKLGFVSQSGKAWIDSEIASLEKKKQSLEAMLTLNDDLSKSNKKQVESGKDVNVTINANTAAIKRSTESIREKTQVLQTENQLLALGYDLEDAKFIAAYAHADDLTQALLRQQREQKAIVDLHKEEADAIQAISDSNDAALQDQIDKRKELADSIQDFLDTNFESNAFEAFDQLGASLYGVADALDELADRQDAFNKLKAEEGLTAEEVAKINEKQAQNQISAYADITGAAKGFFDEGSSGYERLEQLETGFRAIQFAMSAKALAIDLAATTKMILASELLTTAKAKAAIAGAAIGVGPTGLATAAAMIALLAAYGITKGGGGGSSAAPQPNADGSQGVTGSRTVLGDIDEVSESIADSLDLIADLSSEQAGYASAMLVSLQSIERGLVGLNAEFAKLGSGDRVTFGAQSIDDLLSGNILGALESQRTRDLVTQATNPFGAFVSGPGGRYAGYRKYRAYQQLPESMADDQELLESLNFVSDIQRTVDSIIGTALSAFEQIGLGGQNLEQQILALNLPDLEISGGEDPEDLAEKLSGFFSSVGDSIVGVVAPSITHLQRAGEGLLETLTRVASQTITMRDFIDALGSSLGTNAGNINEVADGLSLASGGLDNFAGNVADFLDVILTDAEQFDRSQRQVEALFESLNTQAPAGTDQLRDFVTGLDLTTEAGQRAFAAVTGASDLLSDFFDQLEEYAEDAYDFDTEIGLEDGLQPLRDVLADIGLSFDRVDFAAQSGKSGLQQLFGTLTDAEKSSLLPFIDTILELIPAAALADEAVQEIIDTTNLQIRLLQAQGDAEGALALRRQQELDAATEVERAILQQIYTAEDAADAQAAAARAAEEARAAETQLAAERDRIAQEAYGLQTQILQLEGDTAALRARQLETIDPANRALQELIWSLEDQAAATQAAAAAEAELAAERDRIAGLQMRLLGVQGNNAAVVAMQRQQELANASSDAARALLLQIYAAEDAAELAEDLAEAEQSLRDARRAALNDQISDLQRLVDASADLREFANSINQGALGTSSTISGLQREFNSLFNAAQNGDLDAVAELQRVGADLVGVAADTATSELEYRRIAAGVANAASQLADTLSANETELDIAKSQLAALEAIEAALTTSSTEPTIYVQPQIYMPEVTVADGPLQPAISTVQPAVSTIDKKLADIEKRFADFVNEHRAQQEAIASNTGRTRQLLEYAQTDIGVFNVAEVPA